MELQFDRKGLNCLQPLTAQVQTQELTQEVRLPDGMPDIGRVLGAWSQLLVRSKEWRADAASVSGGAMAWVLYSAEEDGQPYCVEAWLPFQMKWDLPQTQHDGTLRVAPLVRSADGRSTSARKLMVRVGISVLGEAVVPGQTELCIPTQVPEDVQLLKKRYPVRLPVEAGEKPFAVEEELILPPTAPKLDRIVYYSMQPEIIDRKIMTDKVVFRGELLVHMLYKTADGSLQGWDFEVPFSQYTDLDREYEPGAEVSVLPAATNMEMETTEDGGLRLKAGLTGQYMVYDAPTVELVEDAYSTARQVDAHMEMLQLPAVLDMQTQTLRAQQTVEISEGKAVDLVFYPDHPSILRQGMQLRLPGQFQLLWQDDMGQLQGSVSRWEEERQMDTSEDQQLQVLAASTGRPQASMGAGTVEMRSDILVSTQSSARQGLPMVTALDLGEEVQPDPGRPSLILRRAGGQTLWEHAKRSGSTVEAIQKANKIPDTMDPDQILLIPVM